MGENLRDIDRRINALWSREGYMAACALIENELIPVLRDWLLGKGLNMEDAEDVVGEAKAGFFKKISEEGPLSIRSPKAYLWRAAAARCIDCFRAKDKADIPESQIFIESDGGPMPPNATLDLHFQAAVEGGLVPKWQMQAIYVVEGLFEDVEIEASEAARLVSETISRLDQQDASILNHVLTHGPDQPSAEAGELLGITQGNFRVKKTRAYAEFRRVASLVRDELGIRWRGLPEEAPCAEAVETTEFTPSEEDDSDESAL